MSKFKPGQQSIRQMIVHKKRLRIATLSASTLLYSALLTGLFLRPSATELIGNEGHHIIKVRAEIASTDRVTSKPANEWPNLNLSSAPKAERDLPKPEAKPVIGVAIVQSGHRLSTPKPIVPAQMAQTVPPIESDVTQIVASLMASQVDGDPLDFQVLGNGTISLSVDASASPLSLPQALGRDNSKADCQIAQRLQIALQNDTSTKQLLSKVPRSQRSVANVIMAWDADWIGTSDETVSDRLVQELAPTRELLKANIQGHLRASTPECLGQSVIGPEFILIDDKTEPTVLVFGSGEWQWADLVDPIVPASDGLNALLSRILDSE